MFTYASVETCIDVLLPAYYYSTNQMCQRTCVCIWNIYIYIYIYIYIICVYKQLIYVFMLFIPQNSIDMDLCEAECSACLLYNYTSLLSSDTIDSSTTTTTGYRNDYLPPTNGMFYSLLYQ